MAFQILSEQEGLRPAPYLASRGMKWIQRYRDDTMSDNDLREYLKESPPLDFPQSNQKLQRELGINQD